MLEPLIRSIEVSQQGARCVVDVNEFLSRMKQKMSANNHNTKRYKGQTIPLSEVEVDVLNVLNAWTGIKHATLARSIFYRGLEQFLKDQRIQPSRDEMDICLDVVRLMETDASLNAARKVVHDRKVKSIATPIRKKSR